MFCNRSLHGLHGLHGLLQVLACLACLANEPGENQMSRKINIPVPTLTLVLALIAGFGFTVSGFAISGFTAQAEGSRNILKTYREQSGMVESNPDASGGDPELIKVDPFPTGTEVTPAKLQAFREAIDEAFPMNPDMIERFREIEKLNEQAIQGFDEPKEKTSINLISLEPGEPAPRIRIAPMIASIIGFYDVTGAPWPITQYLLGDDSVFQASHIGEKSHNIVMKASSRVGFTNLVVVLEGHDTPASIRINIDEEVADSRFDIQVMHPGPAAQINSATTGLNQTVSEAGDSLLLAAMTGVDLPPDAKSIDIIGVDARAWLVGDDLYLRSSNALLTPDWTGAMTGPDGIRVYRIDPAHTALFSVDGQYVRADIKLP